MRNLTIAAKAAMEDIKKEFGNLKTREDYIWCETWQCLPSHVYTKESRRLNKQLKY